MSCREALEELQAIVRDIYLATSPEVQSVLQETKGDDYPSVVNLRELRAAAGPPKKLLESLRQFPMRKIDADLLTPDRESWWQSMVLAAEMRIGFEYLLEGKRAEIASMLESTFVSGLLRIRLAVQRATVEENQENAKPKRKRSTTRKSPQWIDMAAQLDAEGHPLKVIAAKVNEKFPGAGRTADNVGKALNRHKSRKDRTT